MVLPEILFIGGFQKISVDRFYRKILSQIMNLFVHFFQFGFSEFGIAAGFCHFGLNRICGILQFFLSIIPMLLNVGNSFSHLLQVADFYFLGIGSALLGLNAVLQINHKTQVGFYEQNGDRIVRHPLCLILFSGECIFFKELQKVFSVIVASQFPGRYVLLPIRCKIAESLPMVFDLYSVFCFEQPLKFFKRFRTFRNVVDGIADFFFVGFKFGFHGCDAFCHYLHVGHIKIELSSALGMIFLLCDFFCSRREQIDLIQSLALADVHKRTL